MDNTIILDFLHEQFNHKVVCKHIMHKNLMQLYTHPLRSGLKPVNSEIYRFQIRPRGNLKKNCSCNN